MANFGKPRLGFHHDERSLSPLSGGTCPIFGESWRMKLLNDKVHCYPSNLSNFIVMLEAESLVCGQRDDGQKAAFQTTLGAGNSGLVFWSRTPSTPLRSSKMVFQGVIFDSASITGEYRPKK